MIIYAFQNPQLDQRGARLIGASFSNMMGHTNMAAQSSGQMAKRILSPPRKCCLSASKMMVKYGEMVNMSSGRSRILTLY